ncbi:hypothetical protein [Pedobacter mucosus]|uniref:hypothetical protein n=1 Tax=Pedobacter mucosus TaxID=2895286 RepID=UPI001EE3EB7C|nr:hypothetical protein [Pedobacter mucosus]UKT62188.1 hypothetical protein LOK61_10475 [Pedobacter mucosus]
MRNVQLKKLEAFIGSWNTEGITNEGLILSGTDSYEWIDGCFFVVHRVNISINKKKTEAIEIIYYDDLENVFRCQSFNNEGNITISTLKIIDDLILIFADDERFIGNFKPGAIVGKWEKFDNNNWQPFMEMKLTKC